MASGCAIPLPPYSQSGHPRGFADSLMALFFTPAFIVSQMYQYLPTTSERELTSADIERIRVANIHSELPPGWMFTGAQYVDASGLVAKYHPRCVYK